MYENLPKPLKIIINLMKINPNPLLIHFSSTFIHFFIHIFIHIHPPFIHHSSTFHPLSHPQGSKFGLVDGDGNLSLYQLGLSSTVNKPFYVSSSSSSSNSSSSSSSSSSSKKKDNNSSSGCNNSIVIIIIIIIIVFTSTLTIFFLSLPHTHKNKHTHTIYYLQTS